MGPSDCSDVDSDSSLSAVALAVGLAIYALASTLQAAIASVRRDRTQTLVSEGVFEVILLREKGLFVLC